MVNNPTRANIVPPSDMGWGSCKNPAALNVQGLFHRYISVKTYGYSKKFFSGF
jgi:hypothetical protein